MLFNGDSRCYNHVGAPSSDKALRLSNFRDLKKTRENNFNIGVFVNVKIKNKEYVS